MEFSISLGYPNSVFIDQKEVEEKDFNFGDPVSVEIDEWEDEIVAKAKSKAEFEESTERCALFYALDEINRETVERLHTFFQIPLDEDGIDLSNIEKLRRYLGAIEHLSDVRDVSSEDMIIGINLLELYWENFDPSEEEDANRREEMCQTPLTPTPEAVVEEVLNGEPPYSGEVTRYRKGIFEPSEVFVCTNRWDYPDKLEERARQEMADKSYLMNRNYMFPGEISRTHGPILKSKPDVDEDVIRVSSGNVRVTSVLYGTIHPIEQSIDNPFNFEGVKELAENIFEDIEDMDRDNAFLGDFSGYSILFYVSTDEILFDIQHAVDEEIEKGLDKTGELSAEIDEELSIQTSGEATHYPVHPTAIKSRWVLDTNALYQQKPGEGSSPISEFILNQPSPYGKEIFLPFEVLCEVNRHKTASGDTKRASEQGVENIQLLNLLDEFGLISFNVGSPPETVDNSIVSETGATDLSLIKYVDENSVLVTNDERLLKICRSSDVPAQDIQDLSSHSAEGYDEDIWEEVQQELLSGRVKREEINELVEENLESYVGQGGTASISDDIGTERDRLVKNWINQSKVVKIPGEEGQMYLQLSQEGEVVPSYGLISDIINNTTEVGGESYMSSQINEKIRSAVGGYQSHEAPFVVFCIPERYVYKAKEVGQIQALYQLTNLENAGFKSIRLPSQPSDLDNTAVKAAKETNATLLCESTEDGISSLSHLLGIKASEIDF